MAPVEAAFSTLGLAITGSREFEDFTAYTVQVMGELSSKWEVDKRYSSFDALHDALRAKFPSAALPELPGKKFFGNRDPDFVQQRGRDLQTYLQRLAGIDIVGRCEEVMLFLSSSDTGERPRRLDG